MNKDRYGRYAMHCRCGQAVLVSFKWLYAVGHCLKWYGCQLPDSSYCEGWIDACLGCGIRFGYPPPLQEYQSLLVNPPKEKSEQPRHDGKLGKHEVSFWPESSPEFVCIEEADGWKADEPDFVQLTAEQALSLLAWLEENKPVLEKLVQENSQPTA